jgi:hypothetical protein
MFNNCACKGKITVKCMLTTSGYNKISALPLPKMMNKVDPFLSRLDGKLIFLEMITKGYVN